MATHVELFEEGLRTRVQIPPAPPYPMTKAANYNQLAAFFFGKSTARGIASALYKVSQVAA